MGQILIITDGEGVESALRRRLDFNPILIGDRDLILVDVNVILNGSQQSRADRAGLAIAQEYAANPNNVVILLGLEPEHFLRRESPDFVGLMAKANVDFADIISLEGILPKYQDIVFGNKREDKTALAIYDFQRKQQAIAILKHIIRNVEDDSRRNQWLIDARKLGIGGTDEEVISYVRAWKPETAGEFQGKYLEGIFVDAYQTLFDDNWQIVESVKEKVTILAKNGPAEIFVISDSEETELKTRLANNQINWPLLSKYNLRGAILEMVIDNLSQEEFEATYQIKADAFVNVSES
jgi:hypothetical protein